MKNNWVYIALIIGLVLAAVVLWESPPKILQPKPAITEVEDLAPYAVIDNAHTRHFDEQGELSYQFFAKELRHFRLNLDTISEGDYTALASPKLTLHTEDGPWYITANLGRVTDNGNTLTLWDKVRIWQTNETSNAVTELTTDKLIIYPLDKTVETTLPVTITSPQGQLEATGMSVNLTTKHIKLHSQVRGHHEPI